MIIMVKHTPRRRRRRRLIVLKSEDSITLGTLGNNIVVKQVNAFTIQKDFYCVSMDVWADVRALVEGEVPIKLGLASADLTTPEIEEALDANMIDPGDVIAEERTRRPVRTIGRFSGGVSRDIGMNDGKATRTKVRILFREDKGMALWAQNKSGFSLTTGATITFQVNYYGFWA